MTDVEVAARGGGRLAGWFREYESALAQRDLRLLLGGLAISATGSWAYTVALLAFVFDQTHSVVWVGVTGAVRCLSAVAVGPYAGVIAERTERIRLMVTADLACLVLVVGLAVAAAAGAPIVVVVALAGLTTATSMVYPPSVAATIPSIVDEDQLVAANALNETINNLVVVAGPALGAVLLLFGSPPVVFAINAASFGLSAVLVSRIRTRTKPVDVSSSGAAGPLRQIAVGLRAIVSYRSTRTLVAFCLLVTFLAGADEVLFVAVSAQKLGTGARGYGYLLAGVGVGGILMAGAVNRLARFSKLAVIILAGTLGFCLPTALLTVVHSAGLAFAIQILRGGCTLVVDVLAVTVLQRAVPSDQIARVFGIFWTLVMAMVAVGALVAPPLINGLGLDGALLTLAFVPAGLALLGLPALLAIDRETSARAASLAPRVALLEQLEIFETASRPLLERLAESETDVEYAAGTTIVREGESAEALYVLVEGEVEVTARGERGSERVIRTLSAPSYFGEIGVLHQLPRTATVTAVSDCRCEQIDGAALLDTLTTTPASASMVENARARLAVTHPSLAAS